MVNTIGSLVLKFFVGFIVIILISALPSMFMGGIHINWAVYYHALSKTVSSLIHIGDMVYYKPQLVGDPLTYKVFPTYWQFYFYSLKVFGSAFVISFIVGFLLTFLTIIQSKKVIRRIRLALSLLESIPDLFILISIESIVIFVFQKWHVLLFNIAGAFKPTYAIPILMLTILPSILFFRILLLAALDEEAELYVDLAKTKGLTRSKIIISHIFRNALITLGSHVKSIFFFLFSNLVMVEYIFNIYGVTFYIFDHQQLDILTVSILLFYVPVFLVMAVIRLVSEYLTGKEVAV